MCTIIKVFNLQWCSTLHLNIHLGTINAYTKGYHNRASANGESPNGVA